MASTQNYNADLHVLVIPAWYPNGKDKLIGIYHKHFCAALADAGVKVNMLYVDRLGMRLWPKYPFIKKYVEVSEKGYTTYMRRMPNLSRISYDLQMRSYVRYLKKLYYRYEKEHGRPNVLHAQVAVPSGYAACCLGEELGIPVVITEHASYFERFFEGREGKYGTYAIQHADMVSCVGKYMTEVYEAMGIQASVLPNVVDCSVFGGEKIRRNDAVLHITTICALRAQKLIDDAIAALKILRDRNSVGPLVYTVAGDGADENLFKEKARQLGMTDCVRFVGRKNKEEIADILSDSDVLLIASEIETFCIPAVEALAAGVPVVSTRCKGPEGFLNADCAELCDCRDPESMADAVERMVRRLPTMDESAIRAAAAQFDAPAVAAKAISYYREVLSRKEK